MSGGRKSSKILIVDDDYDIRLVLSELLAEYGEVAVAKDGQEGLEHAGDADLMVLDIEMPGMTGLEVARALAEWPDPPAIILLSGLFAALEGAPSTVPSGVLACLPKPPNFDELRRFVELGVRWKRP